MYSIVEYFGCGDGNSCGYCKNETTSLSHGMWAHSLTCQDYEDLLNRGWRRSGKYCYKPIMNSTCCPQYTISFGCAFPIHAHTINKADFERKYSICISNTLCQSCDVTNIKLSKSQKKVIKKFNAYIATGQQATKSVDNEDYTQLDSETDTKTRKHQEKSIKSKIKNQDKQNGNECFQSNGKKDVRRLPKGPDPNKPPCRKAKEIRAERKLQKVINSKNASATSKPGRPTAIASPEKSIEDFINDIPNNSKHKFEIKLVPVKDESFKEYFTKAFNLFCKYQRVIHCQPAEKLSKERVRLVRCCPESEDFQKLFKTEMLLFQKYQMITHKECKAESDERQFRRFLVDGPLKPVTKDEDSEVPSVGLGAFHQQYFIDGKLVAVGVLDILPHCVSSKYLFYDPDYSFLSLGTYTALREIYFVRSLHAECARLQFYYMGYYINSCPKMKYKGNYNPSYLLCPETYSWQPIKSCQTKLDIAKYSRLADNADNQGESFDINKTLVLYRNRIMFYDIFIEKLPANEVEKQIEEISEYTKLTGKAASSLLLFRH